MKIHNYTSTNGDDARKSARHSWFSFTEVLSFPAAASSPAFGSIVEENELTPKEASHDIKIYLTYKNTVIG